MDWVDDELINCNKLQRLCHKKWQQEFLFPRSVSRENIISVGYVSDKFNLTMDQNQILKLLTGKNFYISNDVFIRELLQNAVDAVLLRDKMDTNFKIENTRIDLWEWNDKDGNILFRIDDQGTGMTLGMLKKYFLKVGNSYYTSKELKRDLINYSSDKDFFGISRFGIGFLSCFLCGIEAEISTLYFDDNKSKGEYDFSAGDRNGYGLRMKITGLSGYYTLRSQAENHIINTLLPAPEFIDSVKHPNLEYNGYRSKAGTSIVIKLVPGKLGTIDLKASVEKYICGTRMPVFYNGERVGFTYSEIMEKAHKLNGETVYELSDEEKEEYDTKFPHARSQYPKIVIAVVPLDIKKYQVIPNFSGIFVKYNVNFDRSPQWQVMDQTYTISTSLIIANEVIHLYIKTINIKDSFENFYYSKLEMLLKTYGKEKVDTLKQTLNQYTSCPISVEELGDAWLPFAEKENISEVWRSFVDEGQKVLMLIELNSILGILTNNRQCYGCSYIYQGIFTGNLSVYDKSSEICFILENELQPTVDIGRTRVLALPLKLLMAICGITSHPDFNCQINFDYELSNSIIHITLAEWRHLHSTELGKWILKTQNKRILQIQDFLQTSLKNYNILDKDEYVYNLALMKFNNSDSLNIVNKFISAYFQDIYNMKIYYEDGQRITFTKKKNSRYNDSLDKFPPMMFCMAGSDNSRKYLCCGNSICRRGITLDHPFTQWFIENTIKIESHFPRQFQQIVNSLYNHNAQEIIKTVNEFRQQITKLNVCYGINFASLQELTEEDFWFPDS